MDNKPDEFSVEFEAVWTVIKHWDIRTPQDVGYHGATGSNVREILDALNLPASIVV